MATVLHSACGNDWTEDLNSKAYNDWLTVKDGGKNHEPVSLRLCLLPFDSLF